MHKVAFALFCLIRAGLGRRVLTSPNELRGIPDVHRRTPLQVDVNAERHSLSQADARASEGSLRPSQTLVDLFFALKAAAAFSSPITGYGEHTSAAATVAAPRWFRADSLMVSQAPPVTVPSSSPRVQRIRYLCENVDIRDLLVRCDFALCLDVNRSKNVQDEIDFNSLIANIDRSLERLRLRYDSTIDQAGLDHTSFEEDNLVKRLRSSKEKLIAYKQSLLVPESVELPEDMSGCEFPEVGTDEFGVEDVRENLRRFSFILREDGSVDLEANKREAVRSFTELWKRLNGKEEEFPTNISQLLSQSQVKSERVTEEVERLRAIVNKTKESLNQWLQRDRDQKIKFRQNNTDMSTVSSADWNELRRINDKVEELRKAVTLSELNLDMERVCVYLEQELEESGPGDTDLKMKVAEVNFIERQLSPIVGAGQDLERAMENEAPSLWLSSVADEDLTVIRSKVEDLKSRLGIPGSTAVQFDGGTVEKELKKIQAKGEEFFTFLGTGTKVLGSDWAYTFKLFLKALGGKTLKPREVNIVKRTFKDIFTLVPAAIILIIPLSPIGHVLVFGFIQKFFPEFMPSPYTEERVNLDKLQKEVRPKSFGEVFGTATTKPWNLLQMQRDREKERV